MRVAVIGAAGAMGSFFARYFLGRGDEVVCSDIRPVRLKGATLAKTPGDAAASADALLIATPIRSTVRVAEAVARRMAMNALLVDISSVKGDSLPRLKDIALRHGLRLLSVHPLFGPSLRPHEPMRMVVVRDGGKGSVNAARKLFPRARLIPMASDAHDSLMALTLSLTHMVNIAYAKVVADTTDPASFLKVSSPTSALQSALAEGVLSQDPSLCAGIQMANDHAPGAVKRMARELLNLNEMLERGEERAFSVEFRRLSRLFSSGGGSMRRVYRAYDTFAL